MNWEKIVVTPEVSILKALKIIDESAQKIVLVVDKKFRLVGTVTDGDVRRGILNGITLESPIKEIMNKNPIVAKSGKPHSVYLEKMKTMEILQLPVVNPSNELVGVRYLKELVNEIDSSNPVVLMAGGLGKRLRPYTDKRPKPMLEVGGKPMLENIINNFSSHGFKNFIVTVNYRHDLIEDHFGDGSQLGVSIDYIRENKKLGTAGSLSLLVDRLSKPFFVMNADLLTDLNFRQLLSFHKDHDAMATMCVQQHAVKIPFGVIDLDGHQISKIEEKPEKSFYVNAGIYVLEPEVLSFIKADTYLDMPALFQLLKSNNKSTIAFAIRENWMDVGTPEDFMRARELFPTRTPVPDFSLI